VTGQDPAALAQLARQAIEKGEEAAAAPVLAEAAALARDNPQLWQWTALLYRALDRHEARWTPMRGLPRCPRATFRLPMAAR